jgi:hypothetical protein
MVVTGYRGPVIQVSPILHSDNDRCDLVQQSCANEVARTSRNATASGTAPQCSVASTELAVGLHIYPYPDVSRALLVSGISVYALRHLARRYATCILIPPNRLGQSIQISLSISCLELM